MGRLYQIKCRKCHHAYEIARGPLESGPQYRCNCCGHQKDIVIPEFASPDSAELDMHSLARLFVSKKWLTSGRPFSHNEVEELKKLAMADGCTCGGTYVDDEKTLIRFRCEKCKSDLIDCVMIGLAD
jgi:hypothetical protein